MTRAGSSKGILPYQHITQLIVRGAINLAGLGLDVTVVEKAAVPGGRMRGLTFGAVRG